METTALLVVDIQNDFMAGGALPVPDGNAVVAVINRLEEHFEHVIATLDYHPAGHKSFGSSHTGKKPGDIIELEGVAQVLWPDHCIAETHGSELHEDLNIGAITQFVLKGTDPEVDSYSAFKDNKQDHPTGLANYLRTLGVTKVVVAGLALDYCVKFTALDALYEGFEVIVVSDATRAVNLNPSDGERTLQELSAAGCVIATSETVLFERRAL